MSELNEQLLDIARRTGLRAFLHGVNATDARELLGAFVAELDKERATPAPQAAPSAWIVADGPIPKGHVLASMLYPTGKRRTIVAFHAERFTVECGCDDGVSHELNEADDEFYLQEGWYECIQNWDEWSSIRVNEGTVTHWQPLPAEPGIAPAVTQAAPSDKLMRHALHIAEQVKRLGWDENGDEGAWEFVTRTSYETGWNDRKGEAAPSEPVAWACPLSERGEELEHPDVMWEADCGWDEKFKPFPLYREPVATPAPAQQAEGDARPACRNLGGMCACRSGGSFGGCSLERAIASATTSTEGR